MPFRRLAYISLPLVSAALVACAGGETTGSTFQTSEGGFGGEGGEGAGGSGASSATGASTSTSTGAPTSATSTSTSTGATSSSGGQGAGGAGSSSSTGAGGSCEELGVGGSNDESSAVPLQDMGSGAAAKTISGTLMGPDEVDWYRYQGDDDITGKVQPSVDFKPSSFARICQFFECTKGDKVPEISCPAGTQAETSPAGRKGCCGANSFHLDVNCKGTTEDSALVFIRVDNPKQSACVTYSITYEY